MSSIVKRSEELSAEIYAQSEKKKEERVEKRPRTGDKQKQKKERVDKKPRTGTAVGKGGSTEERGKKAAEEEQEGEDGYEPDGVLAPVWEGEDQGNVTAFVAATRPGEGGVVVMPGHYAKDTIEGMQVAVSWAASQVGPLCRWLASHKGGLRRRSVLWRSGEQISIYRTGGHRKFSGPSVTACIALSLVCMLVRRPVKSTVAVTGNLDLCGNVLEVGGLEGKLRGCQGMESIETLLVPEASLAKLSFDSLPADLRAYARRVLRGVKTMTDVIQLAIEDCPAWPASMSPLGLVPSAVGFGYGLRYADLGTGQAGERLVFEAVSRPGKGRLIFTANGSGSHEELLRMAEVAMEWAMVQHKVIAEDLGTRRGPAVLARNRDVHVNVPNFRVGTEVVPQYGPALAVAIASLASGRFPQPHVAMLGHLDISDNFHPSMAAVTQPFHVISLVAQGFRQLVVPERAAVSDDMLDSLGENNIELWVDEDPLATFSSALPNVFGLPEPATPSEEEEADIV